MNLQLPINAPMNGRKFSDPERTADGSPRASVALSNPKTLWFNTGTLCNIACQHCYIESSPTNDALVYLNVGEVEHYLDQLDERGWPVTEIGFTGGEPFMNPDMIGMTRAALTRGYDVLILTNAMQPMMRRRVKAGLVELNREFPGKMTLRVSLDHYARGPHDAERGEGSYSRSLEGMRWLRDQGIGMDVAGRIAWHQSEAEAREGFANLFDAEHFDIEAADPAKTVLFPEMDIGADVPEITTDCWNILGKSPESVMCASSRMVVKRRGAERPVVLACTLIAYNEAFEMGETLHDAESEVALNHPHCAKFCVLGGASCSA